MVRTTSIFTVIVAILLSLATNADAIKGAWELAFLKENKRYCIEAKKLEKGSTLRLAKCDKGNMKQRWYRDGKEWKIEIPKACIMIYPPPKECREPDYLCVQASAVKKGGKLRLNKCNKGDKRQKWRQDRNGNDEITPVQDDGLCAAYSSSSPKKGVSIKLKECSGEKDQGWDFVAILKGKKSF